MRFLLHYVGTTYFVTINASTQTENNLQDLRVTPPDSAEDSTTKNLFIATGDLKNEGSDDFDLPSPVSSDVSLDITIADTAIRQNTSCSDKLGARDESNDIHIGR